MNQDKPPLSPQEIAFRQMILDRQIDAQLQEEWEHRQRMRQLDPDRLGHWGETEE
jgi:hypothetical protein